MKKLYLVLCIALLMLGATACSKKEDTTSVSFDEATLKDSATQLAEGAANDTTLSQLENADNYEEAVTSYGEDLASSLKSFYDTTKDLGTYKSCKVTDYSTSDETASVTIELSYADDKVISKFVYDKKGTISSFSSEVYRTTGQKMIKALLNTVMGMGTVFVVLIFISLIISLLKFVPKLFAKKEDPTPVATVSAPVSVVEEEELVDDGELVAVITAAIMASLGDQAPADGLVVRSIRKVNRKWKNA